MKKITRSKVKLEFITNESARKATFKKRKKGLLKKVDELTTLCGVDACMIIYSQYDTQPEVWPNHKGARLVLGRFMSLSQEDQGKKMLDQKTYLKQRIEKTKLHLEKLRKENREKEINQIMYDCLNGVKRLEELDSDDVMAVCSLANRNLEEVAELIKNFNQNNNN